MVRNIISISGSHLFQESGAVVVISGQPVVVSGQPVSISGQPVVVVSGVYVASGMFIEGVSGVHVYQESGAFVTTYGDAVQSLVDIKNQEVITLLENIHNELKIIRIQLSLITSNEISKEDIE